MRTSPQVRPSPPPVVIPPAFAQRMADRLAAEARVWLKPRVTARMLLIAVGAEFGLRVAELKGPRRFAAYCRARWAFAWLARERLGLGRSDTGRRLGGRDHTTMLWAWKCGCAARQMDEAFAQSLTRIEAALWPEGPPSPAPPIAGLRRGRSPSPAFAVVASPPKPSAPPPRDRLGRFLCRAAPPSPVMASAAKPSPFERSHA